MKNWKTWARCAAVRAVKTMAQTFTAAVSTTAAMSDVNWPAIVLMTALAGIFSVATSLKGLPEVNNEQQ